MRGVLGVIRHDSLPTDMTRCRGVVGGFAKTSRWRGVDGVMGTLHAAKRQLSQYFCQGPARSSGGSLTILNCLEVVDALAPTRRGCARDSRTEERDFLVLRFLLQIRLRHFLDRLLVLIIAVLEAARQAPGALGRKICSSGPLSQNAGGHLRRLNCGKGSCGGSLQRPIGF